MRFYEEIPRRVLADDLKTLGGHARRLLSECVEHQEVIKTSASKSAESLYDAGFIFIRETGNLFAPQVTLRPSLLGEEALESLEMIEEGLE
jgi:hypothetical protein